MHLQRVTVRRCEILVIAVRAELEKRRAEKLRRIPLRERQLIADWFANSRADLVLLRSPERP